MASLNIRYCRSQTITDGKQLASDCNAGLLTALCAPRCISFGAAIFFAESKREITSEFTATPHSTRSRNMKYMQKCETYAEILNVSRNVKFMREI